jgi:hypothetical protein
MQRNCRTSRCRKKRPRRVKSEVCNTPSRVDSSTGPLVLGPLVISLLSVANLVFFFLQSGCLCRRPRSPRPPPRPNPNLRPPWPPLRPPAPTMRGLDFHPLFTRAILQYCFYSFQNVDISSLISQKLSAMRKMQEAAVKPSANYGYGHGHGHVSAKRVQLFSKLQAKII